SARGCGPGAPRRRAARWRSRARRSGRSSTGARPGSSRSRASTTTLEQRTRAIGEQPQAAPDLDVGAAERDVALEVGAGARRVLEVVLVQDAEVAVGGAQVGVALDGGGEEGVGAADVAALAEDDAEVVEGVRQLGREADGALEGAGRSAALAEREQRDAEVV